MRNKFDSAARPTIHDLQAMAERAARPARRKPQGPSRAARLHLIDMLSRWGGAGLAIIAGLTIFCAVTAGREHPFRASVWCAIVLGALYVCRRLRKEFRAGEASAARPFRWRANYTSALAVLGAGFGAGSLLILPAGAAPGTSLQTLSLILAGSLGAALLHTPHGRSAAALFIPAALFSIFGAWRAGGVPLALFGAGAMFVAGSAALYLISWRLRSTAARRFPRTAFIRREPASRPGRTAEPDIGAAAAI